MSKAILFSKRGCTPCSSLKKFLLTETELDFVEYDVEKDIEITQEYGIMATPTLIIGDERVTGFNPSKVVELIEKNK